MNTLATDNAAAAIIEHHNQAIAHGKRCREHIIEVGRLLWEKKRTLAHGEWIPWIERNLPFGRRTASEYIARYSESELFKWELTSHLNIELPALVDSSPLSRDEAAEMIDRIRDELEKATSAVLEAAPEIDRFRQIRDQKAYMPENGSFDLYLSSLGIDCDWFQKHEQLVDAAVAWSNGGPPNRLFSLLGVNWMPSSSGNKANLNESGQN